MEIMSGCGLQLYHTHSLFHARPTHSLSSEPPTQPIVTNKDSQTTSKLANKNRFVKVLAANTHGISSQTYGATVEDV